MGRVQQWRAAAGVVAVALAAGAATGCGSSASLENLRCDEPCEDTADPLMLHLLVDYSDSGGMLRAGQVQTLLDERLLETMPLPPLAPDGLRESGTLQVPVRLRFATPTDGLRFKVGVRAVDSGGEQTNTPTMGFVLNL